MLLLCLHSFNISICIYKLISNDNKNYINNSDEDYNILKNARKSKRREERKNVERKERGWKDR